MNSIGPAGGHLVVGVLWVTGLAVALAEMRLPRLRNVAYGLALAAVAVAALLAWFLWPGGDELSLADGSLRLDGFALFVQVFVLAGVGLSLLLGRNEATWAPGSTGLLLLSAAGVALLAMAVDLLSVLAGFVAALIPLISLAAIAPGAIGREAALKGLMLVLLASVFLGVGAGLLASQTGTTNLAGLQARLADVRTASPLVAASVALILCGLGLCLAVVPFHMLFTDFVEGLPTPGASLIAGGILASGLSACARVMLVGLGPVATPEGGVGWIEVLRVAGLAAVLVGHGLAIVQRRLKRLWACLAGGQAGLVLVTVAAAGQLAHDPPSQERALAGILVFLAVHAVTWSGLFAAQSAVTPRGAGGDVETGVARLDGLFSRQPWLAASIALSLLCTAGMPLTAGFFARLYLLEALVAADWIGTAIAAALSLGLVLVLCIGLVTTMLRKPARSDTEVHTSPALFLAAGLSSLAILLLGTLPGGVLSLALRSAASLLGV